MLAFAVVKLHLVFLLEDIIVEYVAIYIVIHAVKNGDLLKDLIDHNVFVIIAWHCIRK